MAARAGAKDVNRVTRLGESVLSGNLVCPAFDPFGLNFNGLAAVSADQVMVVVGSAGAVEQFAIPGLQRIGVAGSSQVGQSPINSRQADCAAVIAKHQVQLLSTDETDGLAESVLHGILLPGIASSRLLGHLRTFSIMRATR